MKLPVWVLSTCIREEGRPCFPEVFTSEEAAHAAFDKHMREEWAINAPEDENGTQADYPGDPAEAMRQMRECAGAEFEEWEITKHEIDVSLNPPFGPLGVVIEDGIVQFIVSNDLRLDGLDVLVVDYDIDGADETYDVKLIPPPPDHTPEAVLYDAQAKPATGIDFVDLWHKFRTVGPDHQGDDAS
jgi:hypothetical protein